jgi:hypothetical protein
MVSMPVLDPDLALGSGHETLAGEGEFVHRREGEIDLCKTAGELIFEWYP